MAFLCSIVLLISAFLLFSVQPMVAKMLLPNLGGSPAVWNTAMVFYQGALLAGYAYAHFVAKKLSVKKQFVLHFVILALPAIVLPLSFSNLHPPAGGNPIPWMLLTMSLSVGLPFFVLSTTSPLVQSWFARIGKGDPYFLYAASNAGSFLGLLSYPLMIEPKYSVQEQSNAWAAGYVALVVVFLITALKLRPLILAKAAEPSSTESEKEEEVIPWQRKLKWVFLAFVPSSQFIGVTTYLTTDIAVMPLLWVIPLALYLLTMILVFAKRPPIPHKAVVFTFPIAIVLLVFFNAVRVTNPNSFLHQFTTERGPAFGFNLFVLFVSAMLCHGELAKDRPSPAKLTEFFLWMSFGGVLGGMFNSLVAPNIFTQAIEYAIILVVVGFAVPNRSNEYGRIPLMKDLIWPAMILNVTLGLIWFQRNQGYFSNQLMVPLITFAGCIVAVICSVRPIRFGLALGAITVVGIFNHDSIHQTIYRERSFFGVNRIDRVGSKENGFTHSLMNGRILHGKQIFTPDLEGEPLTYYHRNGPLREVFGPPRAPGARVAVIGLGVGTTAAWSRFGEDWTFYEIDEEIEKIARNPKLFTYLQNAAASPKVIIGDARLRLQEAQDGFYDIIAVDAFSSDSIPAHLMTVEAIQLYRQKLKPTGVLALHISNKYLNLEPLCAALADKVSLRALVCDEDRNPIGTIVRGGTSSTWCVIGPRTMDWLPFEVSGRWEKPKAQKDIQAWTDDYSSLLPLMNLR